MTDEHVPTIVVDSDEQATTENEPLPTIEVDPNEQNPNVNGEIDEGFEEGFLDGEREREESTESLAPEAERYEYRWGHSYHAYNAGKYILPNDEEEKERLNLMYHAIRIVLEDRLFLAPVQNLQAALDVGTGTGIWAMDLADAHPACEVVGIDLSPIQPRLVPPNLHFQIADADEEWTFVSRFDLVHTRAMHDTSLRDWLHCYREAFRVLKPGGWVESQEYSYKRCTDDDSIPRNSNVTVWEDLWRQGMRAAGLRGYCNPNVVEEQMAAAGFTNITCKGFKMPIGKWPADRRFQEAGINGRLGFRVGLHGLSMKPFTMGLNWPTAQTEELLAKVHRELYRRSVHAWWPLWIIYGQKPAANEIPDEGREANHTQE